MACACKGRSKKQYVWTSEDGSATMTYRTEIEARAKVRRVGGSYVEKVAI